MNEASLNRGTSLEYAEETIDRIIAYQNGDYDYLASTFPAGFPVDKVTNWGAMPTANGWWAGSNQSHNDFNVFEEFTQTNLGQDYNLSIQGGTASWIPQPKPFCC
jgi:hypothetical protein